MTNAKAKTVDRNPESKEESDHQAVTKDPTEKTVEPPEEACELPSPQESGTSTAAPAQPESAPDSTEVLPTRVRALFIIPTVMLEAPEEAIGPIVWWPKKYIEKAKHHDCAPVLRVMWPDEEDVLHAGLGAKIAAKVAMDKIKDDPVSCSIAESVKTVASEFAPQIQESVPFWMKKEEYADRIRFSPRFVSTLLKDGLPHHGSGRTLRIPVRLADSWLKLYLDEQNPEELSEREAEAIAAARAATKGEL